MVSRFLSPAVAVAVLLVDVQANTNHLHRRLTGQSIAFACFGGGGDCECPIDNNGDSGVLINVYPGYQCAYPNGACTWEDKACPCLLITRFYLAFHSLFFCRLALFRTSSRRTARVRHPAPQPPVASAPGISTTTLVSSSTSSPATSAPSLAVPALGTLYVPSFHKPLNVNLMCVIPTQDGNLQNTAQTNCPTANAKCNQAGVDS